VTSEADHLLRQLARYRWLRRQVADRQVIDALEELIVEAEAALDRLEPGQTGRVRQP
jgi:hypothetical protein